VLTDASSRTCWIADHATSVPLRPSDVATLSWGLDAVLAAELDQAQVALGCTADEILLAALGRAVARTIGDGMLAVDVAMTDGQSRRVAVPCVSQRGLSGSELLAAARSGAAKGSESANADVGFRYGRAGIATRGRHPLAVGVHRESAGGLRVGWSFDVRSFDDYTVEELAAQFPLALIEVTSG